MGVLLASVEKWRHAVLGRTKAFAAQGQNCGAGGAVLEVVAVDLGTS